MKKEVKKEKPSEEIVEWVKEEIFKAIDHLSDIEHYLNKQAESAGQFGDEETYDRIRAKADQVGYFIAMLDNLGERFHNEFKKWETLDLEEPIKLKKGEYSIAGDGSVIIDDRTKLLKRLRSSPVRTHH